MHVNDDNQYMKKYKSHNDDLRENGRRVRAGGFIISGEKILFVMVRGLYCGLPKGGVKQGESYTEGAVREIREEVGIKVANLESCDHLVIDHYAHYYKIEQKTETDIKPQNGNIDGNEENDAVGVGWVKPECIRGLVQSIPGNGRLTKHACKCIEHYMPEHTDLFKFDPSTKRLV